MKLLLRLLALALALGTAVAHAEKPVNTTFFGVAIKGYDPVAYFTDGKPVEGDSDFSVEWHGAAWHFASAAHRALFQAAPEKYAPQYGGYCAWAVSEGHTAGIDPTAWAIVDGKLYLNYNHEIQAKWAADQLANIAKADRHWPEILKH